MIMDQEFTATDLPHIVHTLHRQKSSRPFASQRALSNDILFDLDPAKTLEALTDSSGLLSTIVEDVTPSERAFGIRAIIACKSIQEWLEELTNWTWPQTEGLTGFEVSPIKKQRSSISSETPDEATSSNPDSHVNYIGCLKESQISMYESRINEIFDAMDDLRVDEIKRQVLDSHFSQKSRPSSSCSSVPLSKFLSLESYSKLNDFTAIITASILQALPKLSKLVRLMEIWRVRICVLWKIPTFFMALEDTEIALKSGWNAIKSLETGKKFQNCDKARALTRETFDVIRYILQGKVMSLGQRLDFMLNTLEGSQDTLPDSWLTRMGDIEQDYGDWVVAGEMQVRKGEWFMDNELNSIDEINYIKFDQKNLNNATGPEDYQSIEQLLVHSTKIIDSKNRPELKISEATQKSQGKLTFAKSFSIETKNRVLESNPITELDASEANAVKIPHGGSEMFDELSLLEKDHLQLNTRISFVKEKEIDMIKRKDIQISDSPTGVSKIEKSDHEKLEFTANDSRNCSNLASNQPVNNFDDTNTIQAQSPDKSGTDFLKIKCKVEKGDAKTKDSHLVLPFQTPSSQNQEYSILNKLQAQGVSEDGYLCLDGSSDCFESQTFISSEDDNLQISSHGIKHKLDKNCSMDPSLSNTKANVTIHSISRTSDNYQRVFVDKIDDTASSDDTKPNEQKSVDCLSKFSIVTPQNHYTFTSNFEIISSTEPINTYLNSQTGNYHSIDSDTLNTIEAYDTSKENCVRPPVLNTDGSSESCFRTTHGSKNYKDKNFSGTKLCSKRYYHQRSTSLPSQILNSTNCLEDQIRTSKASVSHTMHPSLELRKKREPQSMLNVIPSSADAIFIDETGLSYTLKISFDGKITYTNNNNIISTISSSIDISALCIVTLEGCVPSLALVSPGTYSVIPPQPIFSVYYRGLAPNVIRNNSEITDFNTVSEIYRHEIASTMAASKVIPQEWNMPPLSKYPLSMEKPSFPPNALAENSLCQEIDPNPNHSNHQTTPMPVNKNAPLSKYGFLNHVSTHMHNSTPFSYPQVTAKDSEGFSPSLNDSPGSDKTVIRPLFQKDEKFSLNGQTDFMRDVSFDVTPPDSPLLRTQKFRSRSFGSNSLKSLTTLSESKPQKPKSSSPVKTDSFGGTKRNKNDLFQRQISSLLETMPSLICLSPQSEPKSLNSQSIRPKRSSRSLTPHSQTTLVPNNFSHSQSSTPLYTLVPANSKATARSKHHNNSEIRVYHLSRSNGEAPIKLFVRLVGEHGERVMVRVGGGWADLGEYLKEFASHHGRLTVTDTVRIHEAPTRKSSANTLRSSSICREVERSSPYPRPRSVIEQRPRNSLEIKKTRRSTGMSNVGFVENQSRNSISRCPSTPIPVSKCNTFETPPSGTSSDETVASVSVTSGRSSRMSWNEEDFNLGLAGPRSKKILISDRDQEWIESMKEKVRMASAEKDRRNRERTEKVEKSRNRGLSFDGLERVGGTRRYFRRDESVA